MSERPRHEDDRVLPPDAPPRSPRRAPVEHDAKPESPAENVEVTPLDDDRNIDDGIEVNET